MPALNGHELGNALWAFAKWGRPPSDEWLDAYLSALAAAAVRVEPPGLCSALWGAAVLGVRLPAPLVDSILLEAQARFFGFVSMFVAQARCFPGLACRARPWFWELGTARRGPCLAAPPSTLGDQKRSLLVPAGM